MDLHMEDKTKYTSVIFQKQSGTLYIDSKRISFEALEGNSCNVSIFWSDLVKHQVSPSSHAKPLLRLLITASHGQTEPSLTFQLESRESLEKIRVDISDHLKAFRTSQDGLSSSNAASVSNPHQTIHTRKRPFVDHESNMKNSTSDENGQYLHSLSRLNPILATVARASLLASDVTLRTQHSNLVLSYNSTNSITTDNAPAHTKINHIAPPVISESDFWTTHVQPLTYHAAEIYGIAQPGRSSMIRSSLDILSSSSNTSLGGKASITLSKSTLQSSNRFISLGVEEIREIFLMYPAVHKAYEEKVPLELSEEQFWKKYLESEFFHRDRGRLGSHFLHLNAPTTTTSSAKLDTRKGDVSVKDKTIDEGAKALAEAQKLHQEEKARVDIASTGDMFSRVELGTSKTNDYIKVSSSAPLAIGQFDLASTLNTERGGKLLLLQHHGMEGVMSTSNASTATSLSLSTTSKETRIIDKYNRHSVIVLNPNDAKVGSTHVELSRISTKRVLNDDDNDAQPGGGVDSEMRRLIHYANAREGHVDHVRCVGEEYGEDCNVLYNDLTLKNVDAYSHYYVESSTATNETAGDSLIRSSLQRHVMFSKSMVDRMKVVIASFKRMATDARPCIKEALPTATFGQEILKHLTKRMVEDSLSEEDALKITYRLPDDFKQQLASYFRRCSELLRHFFSLRRVIEMETLNPIGEGTDRSMISKSKKIVKAMEEVYREIESVRNTFPMTETGEIMRKMYLGIMDQLDWAFKLNRDSSSTGGFVSVDD